MPNCGKAAKIISFCRNLRQDNDLPKTKEQKWRCTTNEVLNPKHFIEQAPHEMHIFVANLHEDGARLGEQFAGGHQPVTKVRQVRMDAQLPRVAERLDLFRLSDEVVGLAVLHVSLACGHLPVRAELDAVRVDVDHLDLALEPLLFRQRSHDQQRVAENQPVSGR